MNKRIRCTITWADEPLRTFEADCMIGQYDGVSNDDDMFFWFESEAAVEKCRTAGAEDFIVTDWRYV